jgi:hypothetical protein
MPSNLPTSVYIVVVDRITEVLHSLIIDYDNGDGISKELLAPFLTKGCGTDDNAIRGAQPSLGHLRSRAGS